MDTSREDFERPEVKDKGHLKSERERTEKRRETRNSFERKVQLTLGRFPAKAADKQFAKEKEKLIEFNFKV